MDKYDIKNMRDILFNIMDFIITNKFNILELLFMIQVNFLIKKNQYEKYRYILDNLNDDKPETLNQVHQFMLGGGKTSVITPLLALNLKLIQHKDVLIITLEHLVDQTKSILSYLCYLLDIKNDFVYSVDEYKKRFITGDKSIGNKILIIDEFDNMFDANNSLFNFIVSDEKTQKIFEKDHTNLFESTIKILDNSPVIDSGALVECYKKTIRQCSGLVYNDNYGFLHKIYETDINDKIRFCIPFARKDTPIRNSNFSSILIPIYLTFKHYLSDEEGKGFDNSDAINLINNKDKTIKIFKFDNVLKHRVLDIINDPNTPEDDKIKDLVVILKEHKSSIIPQYLYHMNESKFSLPTKQLNMSFQDVIMDRFSKKQVGYTGTITGISSLTENNYSRYSKEIIPDNNVEISYSRAMEGCGCNGYKNRVDVLKINEPVDVNSQIRFIIDRLDRDIMAGFVDLAGLFVSYDNIKIAKQLKEYLRDKRVIYFNLENKALEYVDENNSLEFNKVSNGDFYYYDKAHVVGTDIEQKRMGHFIILVDDKTRKTDFIQAIFRFRKLNQGTFMNIIKVVNPILLLDGSGVEESLPAHNQLTNDDIKAMLHINEVEYNNKQKPKIELQYLKALVRKQTLNYEETDIKQNFEISGEFNCEKYFLNNILQRNYVDSREESKGNESNIVDNILKQNTLLYGSIRTNLFRLLFDDFDRIEIVLNRENKVENEKQKSVSIDSYYSGKSKVKKSKGPTLLLHLNCYDCYKTTMIPLFNQEKTIYYLSYNLGFDFGGNTLLCLVKIEDCKYMLEYKSICDFYYFHKLPVYDIEGHLLNDVMLKYSATTTTKKIDISMDLIVLFNFKTKDYNTHRDDVRDIYKKLNMISKQVVNQYFINYFSRYFRKSYNEPEETILSSLKEDIGQLKPKVDISKRSIYNDDDIAESIPYSKHTMGHNIIGGNNFFKNNTFFIIIIILLVLLIIYMIHKNNKKYYQKLLYSNKKY